MNVGTTWWVGPPGRGRYPYTEAYVRALQSQVPGLSVLSNQGYQPLREPDRYCGWFSKLEWLAPWNADLRPCLVIDLDTFVFDVEPILGLDSTKFWMIRQFLGTKQLGESGMFIVPKDCDAMWDAVLRLRTLERGDGDFLRQFPHSFIPDEVGGIYSYKVHCREKVPADAKVCCFHGRPRPHEAGGWAQEYFERHAG